MGAALAAVLLGLGLAACGLVDGGVFDPSDEESVLSAFSTHHATPSNGVFPPRDGPPTFVTNTGWEVVLEEAYVTTLGLTIHRCAGAIKREVEFYWGYLPEDLNLPDLETYPMGGVVLSAGDWCGATVHYGPFMPGEPADYKMPNPDAIGSSLWIRGVANKDGQLVPINVDVTEAQDVLLPLTDVATGEALAVTGQNEPDITISKSYDKFFEDIDFASASPEQVQAAAFQGLRDHTFVTRGTMIVP
jgi:hypothetical protein